MSRVYVGGLKDETERDLEDLFRPFGSIHYCWVAKKPPGFAFIDYEDPRDAEDAVKDMNGHNGWKVEISRKSFGARGGDRGGDRGGGRGGGREMACYNCGEVGHLARDCRARGVAPRRDRSPPRRRSPSPRRSRSPYRRGSPPGRRGSGSPVRRARSRSPVGRARSRSPVGRARSRSPVGRGRSRSPVGRGRSRSPARRARSPY